MATSSLNMNAKFKYKLIALFGKSGSGKDTIQNKIVFSLPNEIHKIVPYTTRPKRENEIDHKDYHFVTAEIFDTMIANDFLLEKTCFNNWYYGTSIKSLNENKINIGVFNPQAIQNIFDNLYKNQIIILPIQIYTNNKIRLIRSLNREENPNCLEICRRFLADEKDFENINFPYIAYNNNEAFNEEDFNIFFNLNWFNNYFDNFCNKMKDKIN